MTCVIREGDSTNTGGIVLNTSASQSWQERRLARMGDPVWCPECGRVGFIAQGNPTYIDTLVAVATDGQAVQCGCPKGTHRLIASQDQLHADMEAAINIPKEDAKRARKRARRMASVMPYTQGPHTS